ncbi:MAG TPA: LCP family protein [Acidimicrobiales bacterium]|nr:LCP family protein [Acidimicrobiales bacterium]
MPDGRHGASRGRPDRSEEAQRRALANEQALRALGDAVDQRNGQHHRQRRHLGTSRSRRRRRWLIASLSVVVAIALVLAGGYLYAQYRFDKIPKIAVHGISYPEPSQPFNILAIGSDSRAGLSGQVAKQTGASSVSGQRSDVVKIIHVDPVHGTVSIVSIPRDTMVTLLANTSLYGRFNRINVNYGNGPSLLVQTITANFGIPINHVIQVSFGGLINSADAIHGVYLDFPYRSRDPESGLNIRHPGCQLVSGFQALAVARSRHYYYSPHDVPWPTDGNSLVAQGINPPGWYYDGTSDFGRIIRQNAFLRAMLNRVKGDLTNPIALNGFFSNIPTGVTLDNTWSLNELIGLALKFHSLSSNAIRTYTLNTTPGVVNGADVLFVQQPYAQQTLVSVFGSQLIAPTNPPPNQALQTPMPPHIAVTASNTPTTTVAHHHVTTTTNPTLAVPSYDPVPCEPK